MTTETVQDAFEEAAAEQLLSEAQTELDGEGFEKPVKTRRQLAEEFLEHFQADVEKAETALFNARRKLREAQEIRDDAEENLRRAIREENSEEEATADDEEDASDLGQADDPITGEVARTCRSCSDNPNCNLRMPGSAMGCGGNAWKEQAA